MHGRVPCRFFEMLARQIRNPNDPFVSLALDFGLPANPSPRPSPLRGAREKAWHFGEVEASQAC